MSVGGRQGCRVRHGPHGSPALSGIRIICRDGFGLRSRFHREAAQPVTPDELAAVGRPRMIRGCLQRAELMRPDLAPRVERLAACVTPCDNEARFWALKIVWARDFAEGKS